MEGDKREKASDSVRDTDVEPYTALRWVGTLFKAAAVFLAVAMVGEFVAGLRMEGPRVLPVLMGELARTAVLAVVLWGAGDLVRLLIQLGNDVRAERILLSRLADRTPPPVESSARDEHASSFAPRVTEPEEGDRTGLEEGRRTA